MKIVRFNDGTFGVRRRRWYTLFTNQFLDIKDADYWWTESQYINKYCKASSMEIAVDSLNRWNITNKRDIGTPV
jgi:hypothetical protein